MARQSKRYNQIKKMSIEEMAAFLSFYFDCSRCPAKKEGCAENDASCMDAIKGYLDQPGQI